MYDRKNKVTEKQHRRNSISCFEEMLKYKSAYDTCKFARITKTFAFVWLRVLPRRKKQNVDAAGRLRDIDLSFARKKKHSENGDALINYLNQTPFTSLTTGRQQPSR